MHGPDLRPRFAKVLEGRFPGLPTRSPSAETLLARLPPAVAGLLPALLSTCAQTGEVQHAVCDWVRSARARPVSIECVPELHGPSGVRGIVSLVRLLDPASGLGRVRVTKGVAELLERRTELAATLGEVTRIVGVAHSVEKAAEVVIERVCRGLGWCAGHLYLEREAEGGLADTDVWWSVEPGRFAGVRRALRDVEWAPTADLAGRVIWERCPRSFRPARAGDEPVWWPAARAAGLTSAVAFPVSYGDRSVGVLELFEDRNADHGGQLLPVLAEIGAQLGRVVARAGMERSYARIAEEERRRIGQDLHDTVGQELAVAGLAAAGLRDRLRARGGPAAHQAAQLAQTVEAAKAHLRSLARGLALELPESANLTQALGMLAESVSVGGVSCRVEGTDELPPESETIAIQLLRIAQQAVNNALVHGKASNVTIRLSAQPGARCLEIQDDGGGLGAGAQRRGGSGMRIMRHRAGLLGGQLRVESPAGRGTLVTCVVPVPDGKSR